MGLARFFAGPMAKKMGLGLKDVKGVERLARDAGKRIDRAISLAHKVRRHSVMGAAVLGGGAGAALAGKDDKKLRALVGAALGAGAGGLAGRVAARSIGRKAGDLRRSRALLKKVQVAARGLGKEIEASPKSKIMEKVVDTFL